MAIITFQEIIDIIIMSLVVGYIFMGIFKRRQEKYDPLLHYKPGFNLGDFKFAVMVTAPAIILHEFGHKFVAMGFGIESIFHAAYFWLGIGILLKVLGTGFIFFVPAYVSIAPTATHLQYSMIAVAGPLVNLLIWGLCTIAIKAGKVKSKYMPIVFLTKRINGFLFVFNMLPFPPNKP